MTGKSDKMNTVGVVKEVNPLKQGLKLWSGNPDINNNVPLKK